jgi:hypothetical protein
VKHFISESMANRTYVFFFPAPGNILSNLTDLARWLSSQFVQQRNFESFVPIDTPLKMGRHTCKTSLEEGQPWGNHKFCYEHYMSGFKSKSVFPVPSSIRKYFEP